MSQELWAEGSIEPRWVGALRGVPQCLLAALWRRCRQYAAESADMSWNLREAASCTGSPSCLPPGLPHMQRDIEHSVKVQKRRSLTFAKSLSALSTNGQENGAPHEPHHVWACNLQAPVHTYPESMAKVRKPAVSATMRASCQMVTFSTPNK